MLVAKVNATITRNISLLLFLKICNDKCVPFYNWFKGGKNYDKEKGQQLTLEDRVKLQTYLEDGIIIKAICLRLKVSKQTIYREIQRNSIYKYTGNFNGGVDCVNYIKCQKTKIKDKPKPYLLKGHTTNYRYLLVAITFSH